MGSPLPPDPYEALGVAKDAASAAIKTAHRRLVLKCHPDKVTDPKEKEAASDKFHKIQSAYEILIDDARRERYDAQVRLAELKKEQLASRAAGGRGGADVRSSPYREASRGGAYASRGPDPRVAPQYEERKPSYADYFDSQPRSTARKEPEYERTERNARRSARETKEKPKPSSRGTKESERERRKEKTREAERDARRERERKYNSHAEDEEVSESESDEYERRYRRMREEDEARKAREAYYAHAERQRREAEQGYYDDRTRKMFAADDAARAHIMSSRGGGRDRSEPERRPSPVRMGSSKEFVRRADGRPAAVRRSSTKPGKETKASSKDSRKTPSRTPERMSSEEKIVEERRPPPLHTAKSSPADIHIPAEKPRAASLQPESDPLPIPKMRRAETTPLEVPRRTENTSPPKPSNLRTTEDSEPNITSAAAPEYRDPFANQYRYGRQYADDGEYATPDGYRTEVREPGPKERVERERVGPSERPQYTRKVTRSPSPDERLREPTSRTRAMRETREMPRETPREARETRDPRATTQRSNSARYAQASPQPPPPLPRTTSTSYVYKPGEGVERAARPPISREPSPRDPGYLYGEVLPSGSPRQRNGPYAPPPSEEPSFRYQKQMRPEDVRFASGYNAYSKRQAERPSVSRTGSGNHQVGVRA